MFDMSEMKKINSRQKVSYFDYAVWHVKMMDYLWFSLFSRIVKPDQSLTWQRIDFQDFNLSIRKSRKSTEISDKFPEIIIQF